MSFETLRPPKQFLITHVDNDMYEVEGKMLTKEEYEEWRKTLRPFDFVIMLTEFTTRDIEDITGSKETPKLDAPVEQIQPIYEPVNIDNTTKNKHKRKRFKQAKEKPALIPQEQPAKPIKPELKTYGLMSEYGLTWGIDKRKYVEETTEP